ncbi:MAG TPA: hypothetical protein VFW66_03205 [Gemmatimonadales bacterium]|nr:hypothetical protein [Gemmatimonadales bacterium]
MWAQAVSALLGIWLMAAPAVLGVGGGARDNDLVVGPIAAAIGIVAVSEVTRPVRRVNLVIGLWLVLVAWAFGGGAAARVNDAAVGLLLIGLATVRGRMGTAYGGGWSTLWRTRG